MTNERDRVRQYIDSSLERDLLESVESLTMYKIGAEFEVLKAQKVVSEDRARLHASQNELDAALERIHAINQEMMIATMRLNLQRTTGLLAQSDDPFLHSVGNIFSLLNTEQKIIDHLPQIVDQNFPVISIQEENARDHCTVDITSDGVGTVLYHEVAEEGVPNPDPYTFGIQIDRTDEDLVIQGFGYLLDNTSDGLKYEPVLMSDVNEGKFQQFKARMTEILEHGEVRFSKSLQMSEDTK